MSWANPCCILQNGPRSGIYSLITFQYFGLNVSAWPKAGMLRGNISIGSSSHGQVALKNFIRKMQEIALLQRDAVAEVDEKLREQERRTGDVKEISEI